MSGGAELTRPRDGGGATPMLPKNGRSGMTPGCNAIGWTEHVGVMRGLVEGGVVLSPDWKQRLLADPTLLMEAYLANAQAQEGMAHVR